jgi:hypothetical protein
MCGNMREAEEKQTCVADVDEDTFVRFAEFIYGGDYNVAKPLVVLDDLAAEEDSSGKNNAQEVEAAVVEESAAQPVVEIIDVIDGAAPTTDDAWGDWGIWAPVKKKKKREIKTPVRDTLLPFADYYLPSVDRILFLKLDDSNAEIDWDSMYDYTEALCHIRLYVFAERYQVDALKDLVIRKLHHVLNNTVFHPSRISELVDLIQFAYQNTPDLEAMKEPLRSLLTHYVAWKCESLVSVKEFQQLLLAGGPFVNDLFQKVSLRLLRP